MINDEAARHGRLDTHTNSCSNDSAPVPVAAPSVEIRIRLEDSPTVRYFARTAEDAERLRIWLAARSDLCELLARFADYSDGIIEGPPGGRDWNLRDAA